MTKESKVFFSDLDDKDKNIVFIKLAESKGKVNVWEKGSSNKEQFECVEYRGEDKRLFVNKEEETKLDTKKVLLNFQVDGLNYFLSSELNFDKYSRTYEVMCKEKLYKSERRTNFRIQFFPDEDSFIVIGSGSGQTPSIGKLFLYDVSVTGISCLLDKSESDQYKDNQIIENITMVLRGESYSIPKAEVVYRMDTRDKRSTQKKMALKYHDLPIQTEEKLFQHLTKEMRSLDIGNEFEDFIS